MAGARELLHKPIDSFTYSYYCILLPIHSADGNGRIQSSIVVYELEATSRLQAGLQSVFK